MEDLIKSDGWLIDPSTGEVVGAYGILDKDRDVETEQDLWIIQERLLSIDAQILAEKEQLKRITELCQKRINNLLGKRNWLEVRYLPSATEIARQNLSKGKKTYTSPYGEVTFRNTKDRLVIDDQAMVVSWAKKNAPEALKVEESVLVSKIPDRIANEFLKFEKFMPPGMHIEAGQEKVSFVPLKKKEQDDSDV